MYAEDTRIVKGVYRKHFSHLKHLKDELVNCALNRLWEARKKYKASFGTEYSSYAYHVSLMNMRLFLRTENKQKNPLSLEYERKKEEDADAVNILSVPEKQYDSVDIVYLRKAIIAVLSEELVSRAKEVAELYVSGNSQCTIARQLRLGKQYVNECVQKFRRLLQEKLLRDGYIETPIMKKERKKA